MNNIHRLPFSNGIKTILSEIVEYASSTISDIVLIGLFGSFARVEQNQRSDLDILFLFSRDFTVVERAELREFCEERNADLVAFSLDDFSCSNSKLVCSIKEDCIVLWRH